jgi:hypothetical protein
VIAAIQRSAAAALLLTAFLPLAEARAAGEVRIFVYECYTWSDVQVSVDGRRLALDAPARRNDSVGLCYRGRARLGARVRVRVRSGGQDRQVDLRTSGAAPFLHVTPGHAPYAWFARTAPLLD